MWTCDQCGATVQPSRATCWNCRWSRDGQPPLDPRRTRPLTGAPQPARPTAELAADLDCLRCGTPLAHHGERLLLDLHQRPAVGGELVERRLSQGDQVDLYACPGCGRVELLLRGRTYRPR